MHEKRRRSAIANAASESRTTSEAQKLARLPRLSLVARLFAVVAAMLLLGMMAGAEVSIREHRSQAFDWLARDGIRRVLDSPPGSIAAMLSGDHEALLQMANRMLERSDLLFLRVEKPGGEPPIMLSRQGEAPLFVAFGAPDPSQVVSRLIDQGETKTLEVAISFQRLASSLSAGAGENPLASAQPNVLWIGLDASQVYADASAAAQRARRAQAIITALLLIGLWIAIRAALRPIEQLTEAAEQIAGGSSAGSSVSSRSAEAHRLHNALASITDRITHTRPSRVAGREAASASGARSRSASEVGNERDSLRSDDRESSKIGVGHRILLVEDNPVNRAVAVGMLESFGCDVVCAEDGEESLVCFEEDEFELVLMDIQMPRIDGLEATRRMRTMEEERALPSTPIVALTAHSEPEDRVACAQAGMDGHIAKPFTREDLAQTVRDWCHETKSAEPEEAPS